MRASAAHRGVAGLPRAPRRRACRCRRCALGADERASASRRGPYAYDDPPAHDLRDAYHAAFGGERFPVPVGAIAEGLLGLAIETHDDLQVSGMLLPAERRIIVRSDASAVRRRFTIGHELGHWICQCLEGDMSPVYCRAAEIGVDLEGEGA